MGVADPEKNTSVVPVCKRKPAKTQPHFTGLRYGMHRDGLRSQRNNSLQCGARAIKQRFRFAMRDEPRFKTCRPARLDFFQGLKRRVALIDLHGATPF
jgi:hypothetical protein